MRGLQHLTNASKNTELDLLQRANALEEGRNVVLKMVAQNNSLEDILNTLCEKAQLYNEKLKCSVLRLNRETKTLHPIASVSLPKFYCDAIDGVDIGPGVGSCGTAAFIKKRVIVEDINTHPSWNQFKEVAISAGLQACWSEPIIGAKGIIYGTFAIYYAEPTIPEPEDLKFIEISANLAAVVFDNNKNRQDLINANTQLSKTVDARNKQLEFLNIELNHSLKHQKKVHSNIIYSEKMETTNILISGFSHEISTPLSNALTAIEIAEEKIQQLNKEFTSGSLTKTNFLEKVNQLTDVITLNKNSIKRTIDLLSRFKEVNTSFDNEKISTFEMISFFDELRSGIFRVIGNHKLEIDCESFSFSCARFALYQVLINLIDNSVTHGFKDLSEGVIHINIVTENNNVFINYQDNGSGLKGISPSKIFEPFYSSNREQNNVGLGLSIINNLVSQTLNGELRLVKSPVGLRYEIIIPQSENV